ncbi:hypothetical protein JW916_00295 [Candidatus Sumerlaeota bacterium]|nr:hypothetical protein [Candidatus Sumerlaeota bacterium]
MRVFALVVGLILAAFAFSARADEDESDNSEETENKEENSQETSGDIFQAPPPDQAAPRGPRRGRERPERARRPRPDLAPRTRAVPPPPVASRSKSSGASPRIVLPQDTFHASLLFRPLDVALRTGESFTVEVVFSNQDGIRADGFDVSIAYDPQRLQFEGYDASTLLPHLADPQKDFTVRRSVGRLDFSSTLTLAPVGNRLDLVTLGFTARDAVGRTALRFLTPPEGVSAVYSKGANVVGHPKQRLYGVVDALVIVEPAPESDETESLMPRPQGVSALNLGETETGWGETPESENQETAWLALQPPESTLLTQDQDFWVDLVLQNPRQLPIESIGAVVGFDPKILQVVDEDQGNWIADGTNVWDGAFHEDYPFDVLVADRADNLLGRIYYAMAHHGGQTVFPTGVFARVHFQAIAPASVTPVALLTKSAAPNERTYVRVYGVERRGGISDRPDSPARLMLRILPPDPELAEGSAPTD